LALRQFRQKSTQDPCVACVALGGPWKVGFTYRDDVDVWPLRFRRCCNHGSDALYIRRQQIAVKLYALPSAGRPSRKAIKRPSDADRAAESERSLPSVSPSAAAAGSGEKRHQQRRAVGGRAPRSRIIECQRHPRVHHQ